MLKPKGPIALPEGVEVRVVIHADAGPPDGGAADTDPLADVIGIGDSGIEGSLADRHDEFLYGGLRRGRSREDQGAASE